MAKIHLDEVSFKEHINGGLESSITVLKEAKSAAKNLSIPAEFKYYNYLKKLDDKIDTDLSTIETIHTQIQEHFKLYSDINDELNNNISAIENYSITLRQSAIK